MLNEPRSALSDRGAGTEASLAESLSSPMSSQTSTKRIIVATSGGSFGEPRDTYFNCDVAEDEDCYASSTTDIDRVVVQASRSETPRLLCIVTGSDNRLKNIDVFNEALQDRFARVGATAEMMMLSFYAPNDDEVKARIDAADIIYVSGGTSHLLVLTLRRRHVDRLLAAAAEDGTVLAGLSAGLCCWFSRTNSHVTPDHVTTTEGLGWFDALVAPHWDIEPKRHKPFHQFLLDNPGTVGLAFDEHTAFEIRDDQYKLWQFHTRGQVHRGHYNESTGHYSFEPVGFSSGFASLSSLGIRCS